MPVIDKPKEDRVRETISLLRQLQDLGVATTEPCYQAVKDHLRAWVAEGHKKTHEIYFPAFGRMATLNLPKRFDRAATFSMEKPPKA